MGKNSDIWVRLGLKKDGFDKGMDDAAKKSEKTGSKMTKMLSKVRAGWLAIGTAVIAFGREMVQATNRVGDAWYNTLAGIKGGLQTLLAELSNTSIDTSGTGSALGNWFKNEIAWYKRLFNRTKDAAKAGREASKAFDAEFELENSLKIQRAKISGELADLQVAMRNVALSPEARKAATERYRALLEPLYKAEIATRKNMLDAAVKAWLAGTGVTASTQEVSDFFANYGINPEAAAAANPELARIYETRKGDKANQPIFDAITKLAIAEGGLANELKLVNRTANIIDKEIADKATAQNELLANAIQDGIDLIEDELEALGDIDISLPEIDLSSFDAAEKQLDEFVKKWNEEQQQIERLNDSIEQSFVSSMSNGLQAITDMMMGLEDANASSVLAAFIAPFGDMMKNMGAMIMSYGLAMDAFKKAFTNPYVAIAAGAGLMALGSLIASGAQKIASGSMSGATSSYTGGSPSASATAQEYKSEQVIYVKGRISGSDIVIAGDNQRNKWNR